MGVWDWGFGIGGSWVRVRVLGGLGVFAPSIVLTNDLVVVFSRSQFALHHSLTFCCCFHSSARQVLFVFGFRDRDRSCVMRPTVNQNTTTMNARLARVQSHCRTLSHHNKNNCIVSRQCCQRTGTANNNNNNTHCHLKRKRSGNVVRQNAARHVAVRAFDGDVSGLEYIYTTKDLVLDLCSPIIAWRVVTLALNQECPAWLNTLSIALVGVCIWAVFGDVNFADQYLL